MKFKIWMIFLTVALFFSVANQFITEKSDPLKVDQSITLKDEKFSAKSITDIIKEKVFAVSTANAAPKKKKFTVIWSPYVGWNPWGYAAASGIAKKWADKYGIEIEFKLMPYVPSLKAFNDRDADAITITNMEALDNPAYGGIDVTVVIVGDYSNGNDAILTKNGVSFKNLKGKKVLLVSLTVSHYLVLRGLEKNGMKEEDIIIENIDDDTKIVNAFFSNDKLEVMTTWNPYVLEALRPGVNKIFDSSEIPGEILDLLVVKTDVLKKNPEFGEALTGIWYELMSIITSRGEAKKIALTEMAIVDGTETSYDQYLAQLKTTMLYSNPSEAITYAKSQEIKDKMEFVRQFCFKNGLFGEDAQSADVVGIQYPDGSVQGNKNKVKMRFDTSFMEKAANGQLK